MVIVEMGEKYSLNPVEINPQEAEILQGTTSTVQQSSLID